MIPGSGRSPEEGKGYALQYSGLENSMDCIVHWVSKSLTKLSYVIGRKAKRDSGGRIPVFCQSESSVVLFRKLRKMLDLQMHL